MPADPPPSLLISPDRRRRLQQQYDEARQLSAQPRPDFRRVHELLAACLKADPGNILYLDALLANLKRRDAAGYRPWKWWQRLFRILPRYRRTGYSVLSTQYSVPSMGRALLAQAPDILWTDSNEPAPLHQLAAAASECDFDEAELRYLMAARELAADDITTLRILARALSRQGRFEDAVGPWFAVLALAPGDSEAEHAIEDLRGVESTALLAGTAEGNNTSAGVNSANLLERAHASHEAGNLDLAEHYFTQAQSALGGDLALLELRENLRLQKSQKRVEIARLRAAHDTHPKAKSLVEQLEQDHNRLEIDIFNIRAERLPADWPVRLQLAKLLKAAGNYSGAVQRLDEGLRVAPAEPALLLELGECWQHLRQYAKALSYYDQAITAASGGQTETELALLARYRAGVLATAMGQTSVGRTHFAAIAAFAPSYKDVAQRLSALDAAQQANSALASR
jgi:hypothetical protein